MDSFNIQKYFKRGKTVVLTLRQDEDGARQWSDDDTYSLMKLMGELLPEFQDQRRRKKSVWEDVSKGLQSVSGSSWTPEDCRKKWSNMIRTFRSLEEQKLDPRSNYKKIKWPFFETMHELLALDGSDAFPEVTTILQLLQSTGAGTLNNDPISPARTAGTGLLIRKLRPTISSTLGMASVREMPGAQFGEVDDDSSYSHQLAGGVATPSEKKLASSDSTTMFSSEAVAQSSELVGGGVVAASSSSVFSVYKPRLAVATSKRAANKKQRSSPKTKESAESTESMLAKFIQSTTDQNERMLSNMSAFHENALTLMHERNTLLREIRNSLCDKLGPTDTETVQVDSETLEEEPESQCAPATLTLHMGRTFASASATATSPSDQAAHSQINPALVISDPAASSSLPGFQLEEASVVGDIDDTHGACLANLDSFTDSVLPDVFHPTIVTVVTKVQPD